MSHGRNEAPWSKGYGKGSLEEILEEASRRWLTNHEVLDILTHYDTYGLLFNEEPAHMPPSGSLLMFRKGQVKRFRRDGHEWKKKKDGKQVREDHVKLKIDRKEVLNCCYAHSDVIETFHRRSYWHLQGDDDVVLVHYLDESMIPGRESPVERSTSTEDAILSPYSNGVTDFSNGSISSQNQTHLRHMSNASSDSCVTFQSNSTNTSYFQTPQVRQHSTDNIFQMDSLTELDQDHNYEDPNSFWFNGDVKVPELNEFAFDFPDTFPDLQSGDLVPDDVFALFDDGVEGQQNGYHDQSNGHKMGVLTDEPPECENLDEKLREIEEKMKFLDLQRANLIAKKEKLVYSPGGRPKLLLIKDFCPSWDFLGGGAKLLVCCASPVPVPAMCLFGQILVSAEHISAEVLRCTVPSMEYPGSVFFGIVYNGLLITPEKEYIFQYKAAPQSKAPSFPRIISAGQGKTLGKRLQDDEQEGSYKVRVVDVDSDINTPLISLPQEISSQKEKSNSNGFWMDLCSCCATRRK